MDSASSSGSVEDFINFIDLLLDLELDLASSELDSSDSDSHSDSDGYSDSSSDEYYDIDDPLLVEIRRVLNERGDGIVLEGLSKHVHKLKVIYEVLVYYKIPAVIRTENGIEDPAKIDKRSPRVFDELMEDVGCYCKEAMVSLRDHIYEDYEAHISPNQLERLMAKWVEETSPTDGEREEVLHSFTLPIETNIAARRQKRRKRIMVNVMKNLEQKGKDEMSGLKSGILDDFRVKISNDDLSDVMKKWSGNLVLREEVMAANGVKTSLWFLLREMSSDMEKCTKEKLLALKTQLDEHHFADLFITWIDRADPSKRDVKDVWDKVDVNKLCEWLDYSVVFYVESSGLKMSDSGYTL